jgi:hypothetical protein
MASPVVTVGIFQAVMVADGLQRREVVRTSPVEYHISRLEGIATRHYLEFRSYRDHS